MMLGKDAKLDLIRSVPLFEDCSRRELREIEAAVDEVVVPAGYTFTKEGASGKELIVIVEGAAEVRRRGRKINELGAGDFLGEIALISGAPRTATVRTTQPTHALVLTGQAFRRLVRQIPSMQMKVLEALARRLPADLG
jgi:CRP-like cAMP-binding protein